MWTEQKPCQRMIFASWIAEALSGFAGSHSGIWLVGMPIALPVLRPRCWSGKKSTRWPRSKAQRRTAGALDEVQTMPPCSPQKALSAAEEFM